MLIALLVATGVIGGASPQEEKQSGAMAIGVSPRKSDWAGARFLFDPSRIQRSKPDQEIQKLDELSETIEAAKTSASPQMVRALIDLRRLLDAQRAAYLAPPIIVIQPSIQTEAPAKQQINPAIIQLIAELL